MKTMSMGAGFLSLLCASSQAQDVPVTAPSPYVQWMVPATYPAGTTYNLSNQTFYFRNSSNPNPEGACRYTGPGALPTNPYPVRNAGTANGVSYGTPNAQLLWGKVVGDISLTADGAVTSSVGGYCNAAGIVSTSNVSTQQNVIGTRIDRVWDGIRFNVEPCYSEAPRGTCNQSVQGVWISNTRDDAVECDYFGCQAIRDSLFDNVFSFLSINPTSSTAVDYSHTQETVLIEDSLVRMKGFPYTSAKPGWGQLSNYHIGFLKTDPAKAPKIIVRNTVIAAEFYKAEVNGVHWSNSWSAIKECSTNVFLWLPDTPVPAGILPSTPVTQACFTVLAGAAARAHWTTARVDWIDAHAGEVELLPGDLNPPCFP